MNRIDYAARVQRGIALMDEKWPNWATEIDLDTLDIKSGSSCVTAQYASVHGSRCWYSAGMGMLHLDEDAYVEHGFNSDLGDEWEYDTLNGLWKAEIIRRREAARPEASER